MTKKEYKKYRHAYYLKNRKEWIKRVGIWAKTHRKQKLLINRRYLLKKYGITLEQYKYLFTKQKGECAICKKKQKTSLVVDHCHKSKKIRGLLCITCNLSLGGFKDSIIQLKKAIKYLRK